MNWNVNVNVHFLTATFLLSVCTILSGVLFNKNKGEEIAWLNSGCFHWKTNGHIHILKSSVTLFMGWWVIIQNVTCHMTPKWRKLFIFTPLLFKTWILVLGFCESPSSDISLIQTTFECQYRLSVLLVVWHVLLIRSFLRSFRSFYSGGLSNNVFILLSMKSPVASVRAGQALWPYAKAPALSAPSER